MTTMIADMTRGRINFGRAWLGAAVLSVALLGSGCTQPLERDDASMTASPEQQRSAPTQPAVRPAQEASVEEKQKTPTVASKQPAAPEEAPAVEEPAPAPVYAASELMGKSEDEVTALMGTPAKVEQRAASTVWVYQGGDCGLDVFFFLDMATSDERVLTVSPTTQPAAAPAATEAPAPSQPAEAAEGAASAEVPATAEDAAVDVCYGKLRRS